MFWNQFIKLCIERGEKPNPVAKKLNIASGTVTKWKNGAVPNSTTAQKLADYFGVSVDYLLGKETSAAPSSLFTLTDQELALIEAYRSRPEMQPAVNKLLGIESEEYIQVYMAAHSKDKRPDKIIAVPSKLIEKMENAPETDDSLL